MCSFDINTFKQMLQNSTKIHYSLFITYNHFTYITPVIYMRLITSSKPWFGFRLEHHLLYSRFQNPDSRSTLCCLNTLYRFALLAGVAIGIFLRRFLVFLFTDNGNGGTARGGSTCTWFLRILSANVSHDSWATKGMPSRISAESSGVIFPRQRLIIIDVHTA